MIKSKNLNEFVELGNLEDVRKILHKKYRNMVFKYSLDELISNFVLFTAKYNTFEKFDDTRGVAFSTWVYSAIHYSVLTMDQKESRHDVGGVQLDNNQMDGFGPGFHESVGRDDSCNVDQAENNIDCDIIYAFLKTKDRPKNRITFSEAFKHYCQGYTDKDLAKKYKITIAGVGAMKREMRKVIEKKFSES